MFTMFINCLNCILIDVLGVVTVSKPLDYEQMRSTQFVVVAADNGQPPLSSTATVNVNIINVNDEKPLFSEVKCCGFLFIV